MYRTATLGGHGNARVGYFGGALTLKALSYGVGIHAHYNWSPLIQVSGTHETDGYKKVTDIFILDVQP